jgi:hypothetical protein
VIKDRKRYAQGMPPWDEYAIMLLRLVVLGGALILACSSVYAGESCADNSQMTIIGQVAEPGNYTIKAKQTSPCSIDLVLMTFALPKECRKSGTWFVASGEFHHVVGSFNEIEADSVTCQPDKPG